MSWRRHKRCKPDYSRRLGEVLALGDDLAHALNGHTEDRGDVDDAQVALLDQGADLGWLGHRIKRP
jgi:hypothetical protein